MHEAVRRCQGHALSLRLINTLLQIHDISLATALNNSDYRQLWPGKIAENLLDRIFNNLPLPSQQLLCAFSVYREAVPVEAALAIYNDMPKEQAFKFLETLLLQHLIQGKGGTYQLHPIVADYAHDYLARSEKNAS